MAIRAALAIYPNCKSDAIVCLILEDYNVNDIATQQYTISLLVILLGYLPICLRIAALISIVYEPVDDISPM